MSLLPVLPEAGNTKAASNGAARVKNNDKIAKNWCFTVFPLNNEDKFETLDCLLPMCQEKKNRDFEVVVGREICPKSKKEHLQCFVRFKKKSRGFGIIKKWFPNAHIEVARGNVDQNVKYCTKEKNVQINDFPEALIKTPEEFYERFKEELDGIEMRCLRSNDTDNLKDMIRVFILREMFINKSTKAIITSTYQRDFITAVGYYMGNFY